MECILFQTQQDYLSVLLYWIPVKNETWHPIRKKIPILPELYQIIHRVVSYQHNRLYTLPFVLQEVISGQTNASDFIGEGYAAI